MDARQLQAKGYMEDGDLNHAEIGPGLQFNFKPFEKLKKITVFDLDDMKCMPVVFTVGYTLGTRITRIAKPLSFQKGGW